MGFDAELADRIRELLADEPAISEGRMFGGLAFLSHGHMAICASREGGILVRVDPDESDRLLDTTRATPMVMRGRELRGWMRVAGQDVRTKRQLSPWVRRGLGVTASLPPKVNKR